MDFAAARRAMVDSQVRPNDVTDLRILAAMLELPRERFVPQAQQVMAYADFDVPVTPGNRDVRRLLKPMVLAKLIHAANIRDTDHVLDVGCATGYSSALLARLAGSVVALEEEPLARYAKETLASIGETRIDVVTGPLAAGWPPGAPYDLIFLNGSTEVVPRAYAPQLKEGGRLAAVVGKGPAAKAMVYRWIDGDFSGWPVFDAGAPLLPGFAAPPAFVF